jgi:pimeloyl-ACP methyl ester carboxylesterase
MVQLENVSLPDPTERRTRRSRVVLFLHGAGFDHTVWTYQARGLPQSGLEPLVLDFPGHGDAPGPLLASIEEQAEWVASQLVARDTGPVGVVGHSRGSLVGLVLAAKYPELVSGLVLLNSAKRMGVHPDLLDSAKDGTTHCLDLLDSWEPTTGDGGHIDPGIWEEGAARRTRELNGLDALHQDLKACNEFVLGEWALQISVPTLVLSGGVDKMTTSKQGRRMADEIPGAEFVAIEGAGHLMMVEEWESVNRLLTEFFANGR